MPYLVALILSLLLAAPAAAGFEEGVAALNGGDFATGMRELRPLAEGGHADAQYVLGEIYRWGLGVPRDDAGRLPGTARPPSRAMPSLRTTSA